MRGLSRPRRFPQRWSEREHKSFLEGLERLGKGEYKEIATQFVKTRTKSQGKAARDDDIEWRCITHTHTSHTHTHTLFLSL